MEWFTISINPPEINKGQDLIFRRLNIFERYDYLELTTVTQKGYISFEELLDYMGCFDEMDQWAVLTDYNEGNNNE